MSLSVRIATPGTATTALMASVSTETLVVVTTLGAGMDATAVTTGGPIALSIDRLGAPTEMVDPTGEGVTVAAVDTSTVAEGTPMTAETLLGSTIVPVTRFSQVMTSSGSELNTV